MLRSDLQYIINLPAITGLNNAPVIGARAAPVL